MTELLQDLRFALRQLLQAPGFSLTAILSLTRGIAATASVFSMVWAVVMNSYPYAAPDRMMHLRLAGDISVRFWSNALKSGQTVARNGGFQRG